MVILLAAVTMASSGCINIQSIINNPEPTNTPVVVTLTPTPKPPTVTPAATPVTREMSTAVKVMPYGEKGIVSFDSQPTDDDRQYEKIAIVLANDGAADAKSVVLTLTETDAHGGNMLVQQKFDIGDLKRGERRDFTIETEKHDQAGSILIKADLAWGENGEYYNPMTFLDMTKSIIWMVKL